MSLREGHVLRLCDSLSRQSGRIAYNERVQNLIQETHTHTVTKIHTAGTLSTNRRMHTHTRSRMKCESLLIASLPAISSKAAPDFLTCLETAEHSTETLLASAHRFAHSVSSFSLPVSLFICYLIRVDWMGWALWASKTFFITTLGQSGSQAVKQN